MAAAVGSKLGIQCKVYRNTGTYGSPTWVAINLVRDDSPASPWDMVPADSRETPVKLYEKTQIDFTDTLTVRCDNADAGYQALCNTAAGRTPIDLLILDGPITVEGTLGYRAHWHLSKTGQDQAIGSVLYAQFDCKPAPHSAGTPKLVSVGASSALTLTDPG
jgi:hypothetical protein